MDFTDCARFNANAATNSEAIDLHARMGHAPLEVLRKMVTSGMVKDAKMPTKPRDQVCVADVNKERRSKNHSLATVTNAATTRLSYSISTSVAR